MPIAPVTVGGAVGVILSGGWVAFELGQFAPPAVAAPRFHEGRALFAYTAGLFVGVPLAFLFLLFRSAVATGAEAPALLELAALLAVRELAEWGLLSTRYFGQGPGGPYYAVAMRSGAAGIVILGLVAATVGPGLSPALAILVAVQAVAVLALENLGALASVPERYRRTLPLRSTPGVASVVVGGVGYFLLVFPQLGGLPLGVLAAGLAAIGAAFLYRRRRGLLRDAPALGAPRDPKAPETPYGRQPANPSPKEGKVGGGSPP